MADFNSTVSDEVASIYVQAILDTAGLEKTLDGIGKKKYELSVSVDDSELFRLNKHLALKENHLKEVNRYFSTNPITPTIDTRQIEALNRQLASLANVTTTTVKINQEVTQKITTRATSEIAKDFASVTSSAFRTSLNQLVREIKKSGNEPTDARKELQSGANSVKEKINKSVGDIFGFAAKPIKDLSTGFFEGVSNDFGKQISKGLQQKFAKELKFDFKGLGDKAGGSLLKAVGIKQKKENKVFQGISTVGGIAFSGLTKAVENHAKKKLNKAVSKGLNDIFSAVFDEQKLEAEPAATVVKKKKNKKKTSVAQEVFETLEDPWADVPSPTKTPLQIPLVMGKKAEAMQVPVGASTPQKEKAQVSSTLTSFEKAAIETNKEFSYTLDRLGEIEVAKVTNLKAEISKIESAHAESFGTVEKYINQAISEGDFEKAAGILEDHKTTSERGKEQIKALLRQQKKEGLITPSQHSDLSREKQGAITSRTTGLSKRFYQAQREAESQARKEMLGAASQAAQGFAGGSNNDLFFKYGAGNALAYIKAFKQTFQIKSPSKVMELLGSAIGLGLAIGIEKQLPKVVATITKSLVNIKKLVHESIAQFDPEKSTFANVTQQISSRLKRRVQSKSAISSVAIDEYNEIASKAYASGAKVSQSSYSEGVEQHKTTLPGVVLGTLMTQAADFGIVPEKIALPVKHLGAYYQGATEYTPLQGQLAREAEVLTAFDMMKNAKKGQLPDGGVVNMVKHSTVPQTAYTLGGFNYSQTAGSGLLISDVYDWHNDQNTDKNTPFTLPKNAGKKIYSFLDSHPYLAKIVGLEKTTFGNNSAYSKYDPNTGRELFSVVDSEKHDFQLGHSVHSNVIGGKPFMQAHYLGQEQTDNLLNLTQEVFTRVKGNQKDFLNDPVIKSYVQGTEEQIQKPFQTILAKGQQYTNKGKQFAGDVVNHPQIVGVLNSEPVKKVGSKAQELTQTGANVTQSFASGLVANNPKVSQAVDNVFGGVINRTKQIFKIASPSKWAIGIGSFIVSGLALGLTGNTGQLKTALSSVTDAVLNSLNDTKSQGNATLGQFISNAAKAGTTALTGNFDLKNLPSLLGSLTQGKVDGTFIAKVIPLLVPILGLKGLNLGDSIVKILNNNLAIKPGFLNDLFKSVTGINLKQTGVIGKAFNMFGVRGGAKGAVPTQDVINNQVQNNVASLGLDGSVEGLLSGLGGNLVDAIFNQMGMSGLKSGIIKTIINKKIQGATGKITQMLSGFAEGKLNEILGDYAKGNISGIAGKSNDLLASLGLNLDPKKVAIAVGLILTVVSSLHKAFTTEGFNLGKALTDGFKNAQKNWGNAGDDLKRGAKKAIGADTLGDITSDIFKRIGRGTVVPKNMFDEMFDKMGEVFKQRALKGVPGSEKEGLLGNIFSFGASISTMFAPIATMLTSLAPMLLPLLPVIGAVGGLFAMIQPLLGQLGGAIQTVEPLQRRLNFLGGSPEGGEAEMKYARDTAMRLNVPVREGIDAYSQLAIAARGTKLEGDGVRELFEGISSSLSSLGITGQDSSLVFMAYTQILAKGKLSMEELRQQLGERFPPAMQVFAKAMGVSIPELNSMISRGAVLSEEILPKVAKVLNEEFGSAAKKAGGAFEDALIKGNFSMALTRLGNVGFDVALKLTKSFSGVFAMFTNLGANALGVLNNALDQLIPLATSAMIGITAVTGVGLASILGAAPIAKVLATMQNLLMSGLSKIVINLTPFFLGIVADVADGWLGAQNDLIDNMAKGTTNLITFIAGQVDNLSRSFTGVSLFSSLAGKVVGVEAGGNPFQPITDGLGKLFSLIPSGMVELLALVLMFEQVQVLYRMFIAPVLKDVGKALWGIGGAIKEVAKTAFLSANSIKELFANSFSISSDKGLLALDKLKTSLLTLTKIGLEAGIALGMILLARSDFSNPIESQIGEIAKGINTMVKSVDASLAGLAERFKNINAETASLADTLQSKGFELNVGYAFGLGGKSFKSDDLVNIKNKKARGESVENADVPISVRLLQIATWNPLRDLAAKGVSRVANKQTLEDDKSDAKRFGLDNYIKSTDVELGVAQTQLLNQFRDIESATKGFTGVVKQYGLTQETSGKLRTGDIKQSVDIVKGIDADLFQLGKKRAELVKLNTSESIAELGELDKELTALEKRRVAEVKPLLSIKMQVDDQLARTNAFIDAIENDKTLPVDVKLKFKDALQPLKEMSEEAVKVVEANLPVKPLEDVYQRTTSTLRDFEKAYTAFDRNIQIESSDKSATLYSSGQTKGNIDLQNNFQQTNDTVARRDAIAQALAVRQKSFDTLNAVPGYGRTDEQKKEVEELRKQIQEDTTNLAKANADVAKSRYDLGQTLIQQTKTVADYYKTSVREAINIGLEFEKAQNTIKNLNVQNQFKQALIGAGDNIYTQFIESLVAGLDQIASANNFEIEARQKQLNYQNQIEDITQQGIDLQRSLPGQVIPFDTVVISDFTQALKGVDGSVESINNTIKKVEQSLSIDAVQAAQTLNESFKTANDSINKLTDDLQKGIQKGTDNTKTLTTSLTSTGDVIDANAQKSESWLKQLFRLDTWAYGFQGILQDIFGFFGLNIENLASRLSNLFTQFSRNPITMNADGTTSVGLNTPNNETTAVSPFAERVLGSIFGTAEKSFASPIAGRSIEQILKYKPSQGQGFFGRRSGGRQHSKVDFDSRVGAGQDGVINSMLPGTATARRWTGNSGVVIVQSQLPSGKNITSEYGHLSLASIGKLFGGIENIGKKAVSVQAGQKLGNVTMDSLSTGAHLDLGVRINGKYTDPQKFIADFQKGIYVDLTAKNKPNLIQQVMGAAKNVAGNVWNAIMPRASAATPPQPTTTNRSQPSQAINKNNSVPSQLTEFVKQKEGFSAKAHWDYAQYSVGYGTKAKSSSEVISKQEAEVRLNKELASAMAIVKKSVTRQLNQNQLVALASLAYNAGSLTQFPKLLKAVNTGNDVEAARQFLDINKAGGRVLPGLTKRRKEEADIFLGRAVQNSTALTNVANVGGAITPNQMQQAVAQGTKVKLNSAALQQQITSEQDRVTRINQQLSAIRDFEKLLLSNQDNVVGVQSATRGLQSERMSISRLTNLNPTAAQTFEQSQFDQLNQLDNKIAELTNSIRKTEGDLTKFREAGITALNARVDAAYAGQPVEVREKARQEGLAGLAANEAVITEQRRVQLALLEETIQARNEYVKASQADFDIKEGFKTSKLELDIQRQRLTVLQSQLEQRKKLAEIQPLNPRNVQIPDLERNVALVQAEIDLKAELLELDERYYTSGKEMGEEMYNARRNAILATNQERKETIELNNKESNSLELLNRKTLELEKTQYLQQSRMQALQLTNERLTQASKNGIVDLTTLTNELTIKTNELTQAYAQQQLELEKRKDLDPQEKLQESLRQAANFTNQVTQAQTENAFRVKEAELVTNPQARLDNQIKREDFLNKPRFDLMQLNNDRYRNLGGNEFVANRVSRELAIEQEKIRAARELIQLKIQLDTFNLANPDDAFSAQEMADLADATQRVSEANIQKIANDYRTFGQTLNGIVNEAVKGLGSGLTELIKGTKSLNDVLDGFFDQILTGLLNTVISSALGGLFGGGGGFLGGIFAKGGKIPNFADGGVIGAMQRERRESGGKQPVLIAAHVGEMLIPATRMKELEASGLTSEALLGINNYAKGGVVGNIQSKSGGRSVVGDRNDSSREIAVKVETTVINNTSYVTLDQFQQGLQEAAVRGAEGGYNKVQNKMANSPSFRRSTGI